MILRPIGNLNRFKRDSILKIKIEKLKCPLELEELSMYGRKYGEIK